MTKQELQKDITEMKDALASGALSPDIEAGVRENLKVAEEQLKALEEGEKKEPKKKPEKTEKKPEPPRPAPKFKKPEILTQKAIDELTPEECRAILIERAAIREAQKRRLAKARKGAAKARKNPEDVAKERVNEAIQAMSTNIARSDEYKDKSEKLIEAAEKKIAHVLDVLRKALERLSERVEKYAKGGNLYIPEKNMRTFRKVSMSEGKDAFYKIFDAQYEEFFGDDYEILKRDNYDEKDSYDFNDVEMIVDQDDIVVDYRIWDPLNRLKLDKYIDYSTGCTHWLDLIGYDETEKEAIESAREHEDIPEDEGEAL